jgi:NADH-quinone oxidoreductase subunit L
MGGLRKKLPITYIVFLVGVLAISGAPPFAGFFSKDEILAKAHIQSNFLFTLLSITSVLTAIYMFRLFYLTFFGKFRGTHEQEHHLHESPLVITVPLIILAILSTLGGFLGMPSIFTEHHLFGHYLEPVLSTPAGMLHEEPSHYFEWSMIVISIITLAIIIWAAYNRYVKREHVTSQDSEFKPAFKTLYNKYYVDELYNSIIVRPLYWLSDLFYKIFDVRIVDGTVNAVGKGVNLGSRTLRLVQTGNIGFYVTVMVVGVILMFLFKFI